MVGPGGDPTLLVEKVKKYSEEYFGIIRKYMMDPITVCMGCCDKKYSEQYYAIVRNSMMNTKTVYMCFYTKLKKYSRNNLSARICNQK